MTENREKFNKTEYNIPSKIQKKSLLIKKKNLFLFEVPSMCTVEPVNTTTVKVWKIGCTQRVVQGGSLARFTNLKNRGSRFKDINNLFSRITKIRKQDTLFNDLCLH